MPYYRRWGGWRDFVPYEPRYWRRNWRRKAQPAEPREPQPARAPVPVPVPCTPSVAQEKPAEKVFASNAKCASCKVPLLFLEKENQGGSDMHVQCHGCSSVNLIGTGSEQRRKLGTLKLININTADAAAGPLHYNGGKSQLSKGATDSHPVYQCNTDDYDPYFKIVFYDLATSGLARNCDILSLSARSGNTSFKTYINPVQRIEPGATKIHHLTNVNGQLYRLGQHVASVPLKDALGQFLKFLSGLGGPCLLVAHNGTDFASVRLVFAIKCCQMVDEFGKVVNGFVDSLPLFWRKLNRSFNCSQAQLAAEFLQITDGSAKDVEVLQKLCAHFEFDEGHFIDSRNYLSFTNRSISISINKVDDCSTMPSMNKTVAGCMSPSFNKANILHVSPSPGINKANILHVSPGVNKANVLNVSPGINKANILNVSTGINKANNLNVGTSCNKVNDCIISPSINKVTVPCDVKVVFYDLETSGLTKTCDILQLAARCGDNSFETFVKPIKKIAAAATKINHMTNVDGQLHRHGQLLPSVPIKEALEKFYEYLSGLGGQCVLVAHNGLEFDSLRLAYWIKRNRLVDKFSNVVNGFADTLPLFRTKLRRFDRCSQTHLAAEFLQISDEDAHDAVNDVVVLQKLCSCFQFDQGHFMGRDNYITYTARF